MGFRSLYGDLGNGIGNVCECGSFHILLMGFHPCKVFIFVGCIHYDKIMLIPDLINDQIVHTVSIFIAHEAVSCLTVIHICEIIGQQMIEQLQCSGSFTKNFSHMRYIKETTGFPDCHMLCDHTSLVLDGKKISCKRNDLAPVCLMGGIERCCFFHR